FTWTDGGGVVRSRTALVTVHDERPVVDAGGDETLGHNGDLDRVGSVSDPNSDTFVGLVDYGDGSGTQSLKEDKHDQFHLHHKYHGPGVWGGGVRVVNDAGRIGTATFEVTVSDTHKHK